ncbi:hypothetical protein CORC01_04577 [Colletotrichum orchidophilum]|uniref:Uncharacterized protein n=1 Tax=Colletotrichum orchidophilum TaxID=1209926 RepID=A0A1G4BFK6_9PEZI|nr:uncharacterized protein CORC01_04577 [Colletotrichum orchidophilum]OHF00169.1 hypothetical protein CORC01_04577 [Colletotrichum orchidophilum]
MPLTAKPSCRLCSPTHLHLTNRASRGRYFPSQVPCSGDSDNLSDGATFIGPGPVRVGLSLDQIPSSNRTGASFFLRTQRGAAWCCSVAGSPTSLSGFDASRNRITLGGQ